MVHRKAGLQRFQNKKTFQSCLRLQNEGLFLLSYLLLTNKNRCLLLRNDGLPSSLWILGRCDVMVVGRAFGPDLGSGLRFEFGLD